MKKAAVVLVLGLILVSKTARSDEAFGVPVSDKVLYGEVTLPNGQVASFGAREGSLVTVQLSEEDSIFGFLARLTDEGEPLATVMTVEISDIVRGKQRVQQFGDLLQLSSEAQSIDTSLGRFKVLIDDVETHKLRPRPPVDASQVPPQALERMFGRSGGGTCCVTCDGFTVCASSVNLGCGSCTAFSYQMPRW